MLPIIRLTQAASPIVRQRRATPGEYVLYREDDDLLTFPRTKMLILAHRQIMVRFDLYHNHYVVARPGELEKWQGLVAAKLAGKNVRDGLETLVWLPHYRELAIVQLTSRGGVRAFRNLTVAELYGVESRPSRNGRSRVPSPERLSLPIVMDERLMCAERNMLQSNFQAGIPV